MKPFELRPAASIRYAECEGFCVILDLSTSSYNVLDESASAIWRVFAEGGSDEDAARALRDCYDIREERARCDVERFVAECRVRGFLAPPNHSNAPPITASRPAGLRAAFLPELRALSCILRTAHALRRYGFRQLYELSACLPVEKSTIGRTRALAAFLRAENLYVARSAPDDCLIRSLALLRFLRSTGFAAEHVIGVRRVPFMAHAWVELGGEAILDDSPVRAGMTRLAHLRFGE